MLNNGTYNYANQWLVDKNGRTRFSKIFVRLVEAPGKLTEPNWADGDEKNIPITQTMLDGTIALPANTVACLYSETGIEGMKTLRSVPTYISVGKNLGKKNATNHLTQAIAEGQSKWNKNAKKGGYTTTKAEASGEGKKRINPMAFHTLPTQDESKPFDIGGTNMWKEGETVFVGRKIDGNRMLATIEDSKLTIFGRSGAEPRNPLTHIREQLRHIFEAHKDEPIPILDGEIYLHGMPHQQINGLYMNEKDDASMLNYVLFDVLLPNADNSADTLGTYVERMKYLRAYIDGVDKKLIPNIFINDESEASSSAEIEQIYKKYLGDGYEGAILRFPDGMYEIGTTKERRTKRALKLKPVFDSEFEIVGYKDGKGRDKGGIIWILKTEDGKTFDARPADTLDARRKLFENMEKDFDTQYLGKMMTVIYTDTTKDGTPRFPRAKSLK
jgi:ATP-dependent DNA ligase